MKIMCDTNIFLDVMLDRQGLADDSAKVLTLCEKNIVDGFISASCITDIFYIVRKSCQSSESAYAAIGKILKIVRICGVTSDNIVSAYESHSKDFEDCLVAVCAKSIDCDYIITRNKKDFENFGIKILSPSEFLQLVN
jgi:predicted nucleic acid-binding protein